MTKLAGAREPQAALDQLAAVFWRLATEHVEAELRREANGRAVQPRVKLPRPIEDGLSEVRE
jgi:hypothetical protein